MRQLSNKILVACVALLAVFAGCDNDKEKDKSFRYDRVNIGDAKYIISSGSQTKSSTKRGNIDENPDPLRSDLNGSQKLTIDGKLEPLLFFDENGKEIANPDLRIDEIVDVSDDYLFFYGSFPFYFRNFEGVNAVASYTNLLVNKKTEKIYAFPSGWENGGTGDGIRLSPPFSLFSDVKGNIYSGYRQSIVKINPGDNTITELRFGENELQYGNILVDRHGICLYRAETGWRARHTSNWNRITPMDEIDYFTPLVRGNDGYIYFLNIGEYDVEANGSMYSLYRIDEAANNDVKTTLLTNQIISGGGSSNDKLYDNHVNKSLIVISSNNLHEYNIAGNSWRSFPLSVALSGEQFAAQNCLYYFDRANRRFQRLDLNSYAISDLGVSDYEIRNVTTSLHADEIMFTGMRFADSRQVAGSIDASGKVTIITESDNNNTRIENLIQLN
jgi:hypothetical protein